jgi:hypothetical protein
MRRPEFSRLTALDQIGEGGLCTTVEADGSECRALGVRFDVPAISELRCSWRLVQLQQGKVAAAGLLRAAVTRVCVASLEEFEMEVAENFSLRFVPAGQESREIDLEAIDEVPFAGTAIDLGEATAEQLALALDPYPRRPGSELGDVGANTHEPAGPFAALRGRGQRH